MSPSTKTRILCLYFLIHLNSVFSSSGQRSISLRNGSQIKKTSPPPPPPSATMKVRTIAVTNPSSSTVTPRNSMTAAPSAKRRDSKLWSETFDVHLGATQPLSPKEIKRQEVGRMKHNAPVGLTVVTNWLLIISELEFQPKFLPLLF